MASASSLYIYNYEGTKPLHLSKWKIRVGSQLFYNSTILSYKGEDTSSSDLKEPLLKYKSNVGGTVTELLVSEGDVVQAGMAILKVQPCTHPVIMKDLCAECGTDLRNLDKDNFANITAAAQFSMVHVVPELKVSLEQAEKLGRDDEDRLLKSKKLVLLVDLDQTLIHTTNDNVPEDLPDVNHFQLYGTYSPWYHTKLRPGTNKFLENISKYYELHICTFGARLYAHKIAKILDPDGKYFSHRILSRDECFDATSKTANLKALFPRGDHMVCIIDDREDVWNFAPNVIHVKPYTYFRNTGDINAPPPPPMPVNEIVNPIPTNPVKAPINSKNEKPISDDAKADEISPEQKSENNSEALKAESKNDSVKVSAKSGDEPSVQETNSASGEAQKSNTIAEESSNITKLSGENSKVVENKSVPVTTQVKDGVPENETNVDSSPDASINDATDSKEVNSESTTNGKESENKTQKTKPPIEYTETDDYLLYLEEILAKVNKAYYKSYEKSVKEKKPIPDLKILIPELRKQVLKNVHIVFSSVIPTNCIPETHHFWTLAESLGATVTSDLVLDSADCNTTHVVAVRSGTAKVNAAKRLGNNKIWVVTLDWLLCCDERWERADERLFLLPKDACAESDSVENAIPKHRQAKRLRKSLKKQHQNKTDEEKFSERIFAEAGLAFSQDEIEDMDREVEEACSEESDEDSQNSTVSTDTSTSAESLSSGDYPKGWRKRRRCDAIEMEMLKDIEEDTSDAETIGSVDEEMAEAVKQEFQKF